MDKSELKKRKVSIAEEEKPILAEEEIEKVKDELPFKGKVFLARKKKPDSWIVVAVQVYLSRFSKVIHLKLNSLI